MCALAGPGTQSFQITQEYTLHPRQHNPIRFEIDSFETKRDLELRVRDASGFVICAFQEPRAIAGIILGGHLQKDPNLWAPPWCSKLSPGPSPNRHDGAAPGARHDAAVSAMDTGPKDHTKTGVSRNHGQPIFGPKIIGSLL